MNTNVRCVPKREREAERERERGRGAEREGEREANGEKQITVNTALEENKYRQWDNKAEPVQTRAGIFEPGLLLPTEIQSN